MIEASAHFASFTGTVYDQWLACTPVARYRSGYYWRSFLRVDLNYYETATFYSIVVCRGHYGSDQLLHRDQPRIPAWNDDGARPLASLSYSNPCDPGGYQFWRGDWGPAAVDTDALTIVHGPFGGTHTIEQVSGYSAADLFTVRFDEQDGTCQVLAGGVVVLSPSDLPAGAFETPHGYLDLRVMAFSGCQVTFEGQYNGTGQVSHAASIWPTAAAVEGVGWDGSWSEDLDGAEHAVDQADFAMPPFYQRFARLYPVRGGSRLVRAVTGDEWLIRAQQLAPVCYTRTSPDEAWSDPLSIGGDATQPVAMMVEPFRVVRGPERISRDGGQTWCPIDLITDHDPVITAELPTDGLLDAVLTPEHYAQGVGYSTADGVLWASQIGCDYYHVLTETDAAEAVIARRADGTFLVVAAIANALRAWSNAEAEWAELPGNLVSGQIAHLAGWLGAADELLLAWHDAEAGRVRACAWVNGAFGEPADVCAETTPVLPYIAQLRDGQLEVGYLNATWSKYRAAGVLGPWSAV